MSANSLGSTTSFSSEYLQQAQGFLDRCDADGDGQTSAKEINQNSRTLYANIFSGDEQLYNKAVQIADAQAEIYEKYAGDDGILSVDEYTQALNSAENSALLDQYWELRAQQAENKQEGAAGTKLNISDAEIETDKIFSQEYLDDAEESLIQQDYDGDGSTSVFEFYQHIVNSYKTFFGNNKETLSKALDLAESQANVYEKYAGDDGILSAEEYASALNSNEMGTLLDQYAMLKVECAGA